MCERESAHSLQQSVSNCKLSALLHSQTVSPQGAQVKSYIHHVRGSEKTDAFRCLIRAGKMRCACEQHCVTLSLLAGLSDTTGACVGAGVSLLSRSSRL